VQATLGGGWGGWGWGLLVFLLVTCTKESPRLLDAVQTRTVARDAASAATVAWDAGTVDAGAPAPFAAWAGRWTAGMAFYTGSSSDSDNGVRGRDLVIDIDARGNLRGRVQEYFLGAGFTRKHKENDYELQARLEMEGGFARLVHGKGSRYLFGRAAYVVMTRPCVLTWVDRPPTKLPLDSFSFAMTKTGDETCRKLWKGSRRR
jgi:hypothetical protein